MLIAAFQTSGGIPLGEAHGTARYLPEDRKQGAEPVSKTKDSLNKYGDHGRILPGNMGYGTDVNYGRLDDLDHAALDFVDQVWSRHGRAAIGLDIGSGYGRMSVELAIAGAHVLAIDLADTRAEMARLFEEKVRSVGNPRLGTIAFLQADVTKLELCSTISEPLHFVYSQRTFHYLEYAQSLALLTSLRNFIRNGAKLFISVSGKGSDLGRGYGHSNLPIDHRFAKLNRGDPNVHKHQIFQPVCLYSCEELRELFVHAGYRPVTVFESSFGNIKGIFSA